MLLSLPPGTGTEQLIFSEGEGDCTSEMRRGQFSIFGAIEEKRGRRFSRIFCGSRELFEHPCDASVRAFLLVWRAWRESLEAEGRIVHRVCTGNAETVLSSQFSVLSSQFSVLSWDATDDFRVVGDHGSCHHFHVIHSITGITRAEVGCAGQRISFSTPNFFERWSS